MNTGLAAATQMFGRFLETLPDGIAVTASDGLILAVNDRMCELSGYAHDQLVGASIEMLVPSRARAEHVAARMSYVGEGGGTRSMSDRADIVLVRADRRELPVDVALSMTSDRFVVATVRDASARLAAQSARDREYRLVSTISDVSGALFAEGDVDAILRAITGQSRRLLDADLAALVVPHDEEHLRVWVADGYGAEVYENCLVPVAASATGTVIREREALLLPDAGTDARAQRYPGWPDDLGPALIVPLAARDEVLASLVVANRRGGPIFRPSDVTLMRVFAGHAAVAVFDARSQIAQRELDLLEERERFAASMRDNAINEISTASLFVHSLLQTEHSEATTNRLWEITDILDSAIGAIRDAVFPIDHRGTSSGLITVKERQAEWAVVEDGNVISLHPSRDEAERAARWLQEREPAGETGPSPEQT